MITYPVCLCVSQPRTLNHTTDFHDICRQGYAFLEFDKSVLINFLPSVITTWRMREPPRKKQN